MQFKAIHCFVAVLRIGMAQFLVVMIFRHSAFRGVGLFVNLLLRIKEFEYVAYCLLAIAIRLMAKLL